MKALFSLLMTGLMAMSCTLYAQNTGQLVVFIQDGRSISQDFKRKTLPQIKKIAKQNDLKMDIVEASKGAPLEVTCTPAIFYKKGSANTLFDGRYSDMRALSKFVESEGKIQPSAFAHTGTTILNWNIGRATMKTTMQIHPLSGKPPRAKKFDVQQFQDEAMAALVAGMEFFRPAASVAASDVKSYHMVFYPEVKKREGVLLVQMELYSEFDPDTPIFKTEIPSGSDWYEWQTAFKKAGNRLERALIAQISNWDNGDGFDTLKANTPVESWSSALTKSYDMPPATNTTYGKFISDKE